MAGMSIAPMEDTSAAEEPEMPPNNMLTRMFTMAVPPRIWPTKMLHMRISFLVIWPSHITCAIMMKNGTAINVKLDRPVVIF